jgi:ABC-type branched-subunit amino acid transport system substrate-binding protein
MLNAAQMAVFDMSGGNFELMPRDTDGSDASAVAAARDAVSSGAQLIIGPLFGSQVTDVRSVTEPADLNILTLSTDTSLAAPGVFVMGFSPSAQVDRVVSFSASQGVKRFAALIPDSPYGSLVNQAFRQAVARVGGTIVDAQTYDPAQPNTLTAVAALSTTRDRIDALFLPEGGEDLARIAQQLASAGFDNRRIRVLGTGLWDEPNLGQHVSFLIGGWYAASDPAVRQSFVNAYMHSYGQEPPRLATLSYDATALAAVLVRRGEHFDRAALTNPNGFAGVDGIFRLTDQGLVERGLAVDEVSMDKERVVAPAPVTFARTQ